MGSPVISTECPRLPRYLTDPDSQTRGRECRPRVPRRSEQAGRLARPRRPGSPSPVKGALRVTGALQGREFRYRFAGTLFWDTMDIFGQAADVWWKRRGIRRVVGDSMGEFI